jgi:hypothetical protein
MGVVETMQMIPDQGNSRGVGCEIDDYGRAIGINVATLDGYAAALDLKQRAQFARGVVE